MTVYIGADSDSLTALNPNAKGIYVKLWIGSEQYRTTAINTVPLNFGQTFVFTGNYATDVSELGWRTTSHVHLTLLLGSADAGCVVLWSDPTV